MICLVIYLQVPRKLNLNLEVVEQLFFLSVSPPVTAADIPKVLEELQERKVSHTCYILKLKRHLKN